jgi:hypothetical protein
VFDPASIDTTISSSTLHELWSYVGQESTIRAYLAMKFQQLRPGGRLVIRDVTGPEDGGAEVLLSCSQDDGGALPPGPLPAGREADFLRRLSTFSRFRLFAEDFLKDMRSQGRRGAETQVIFRETPEGILLPLRTAAEFLSKKDYFDNWTSEMNEEFCFWGFSRWRQVLQEAGFRVLEGGPKPSETSRSFCSPWIEERRYRGHARLLDPKNPVVALPYPPTNMVLAAEKPPLG